MTPRSRRTATPAAPGLSQSSANDRSPLRCEHGGAFWDAIGDEFDALGRHEAVINADVLDAWFPPAPGVTAALHEYLPWLLRTSPPTGCEGLVRTIARTRDVAAQAILPGDGSSSLIFLAFRHWLTPSTRVLLPDPTYGEYAHLLTQIVRCRVDRLPLARAEHFDVSPEQLRCRIAQGYDWLVLVNPNSPTGRFLARATLERLLDDLPSRTRVWIDETYTDYAGPHESLERFAAQSRNVIVCKSMSKVYALSGARAAYLCGPEHWIADLRSYLPPWSVSLPAQVAAVRALCDPAYYAARYRETAAFRSELASALTHDVALEVLPSATNFLLCLLPPEGPDAATVCRECRALGLYLRDASAMSGSLGSHALRIAVKDAATNRHMVQILRHVLQG